MTKYARNITLFGVFTLFVLCGPLLDFIGWKYTAPDGSFITKVHPSLLVFFVAAVIGLFSDPRRVTPLLSKPYFLAYTAAAVVLVVRAAMIAATGNTQGEFSAAIVTFLIPVFILIAMQAMDRVSLDRVGFSLRLFFLANSLIGLAERLAGHRFIPSFLDTEGSELRAAALLGHPLNASLLTGVMIVFLVSAPRKNAPFWMRAPEVLLHATAMFAFGGRSALVFTTIVLVASAIFARQRGQDRVGPIQRFAPVVLVAVGIFLVFLPIPFVEATISRFANDTSSSQTRSGAVQMLGMLDAGQWLTGVDISRRTILMSYVGSTRGIELAWPALIMIYGLVATIPMMISLPWLLWNVIRALDRSAFYMALLFLIVTAGSLSIGSKNLAISQVIVMMMALSQRPPRLLLRSGSPIRRSPV